MSISYMSAGKAVPQPLESYYYDTGEIYTTYSAKDSESYGFDATETQVSASESLTLGLVIT
jgi:hypothetical protein